MAANPGNATPLLNTITLPELTDLIRREWEWTKQYLPREAKSLYIADNIGAGQGSSKRYKEVDGQTFADYKPEGVNSQKALVGIGYEVDMVANTFSKEIDITLEMRNDNRYAEVGSFITDLSQFCENRQDIDLTHRFTFCNASSYANMNGQTVTTTVGDANPLIYSTHALAFSSTTYNNEITGDPAFSQGAYEAGLLIAHSQIYNNFGEQRLMNFNTLILSRQDISGQRVAKQLFHSMADIDAVQSGVENVYRSDQMKVVVLSYLASTATGAYDSTKRRWWFIAATGQGVNGWQAYVGDWISPTMKAPAPGNNGEDIHNYNWTYSAYCRYGIAILAGRGVVASLPTS